MAQGLIGDFPKLGRDTEKEEVTMEESPLGEEDDTITTLIMSVGIDLA